MKVVATTADTIINSVKLTSMEFTVRPIGYISTAHKEQAGTPIQAGLDKSGGAKIVVNEEFREGLSDLDGFERIWVIAWLDRSVKYKIKVIPYRDTVERGLFATRAPSRPNSLGLSCLEIRSVDVFSGVIEVTGADFLDGTPILDIKPYIPQADSFPNARSGWFDANHPVNIADSRFGTEHR